MLREQMDNRAMFKVFTSREDWLRARHDFITASDAASVLGEGYESPFALWHAKKGLQSVPADIERLEAGLRLEPAIDQWYRDVTGRETEDLGLWVLVQHPDYPWLAATLDRLTVCRDGSVGPLELKAPNAFKLAEWTDDIPLRFHVQNQVQMMCMGAHAGAVASIVGGTHFRWMDTVAMPELQEVIEKETKRFWDDLQDGVEPEPDGTDTTHRTLALLHPKDTGERVALPLDAQDWLDRYETLSEQIKDLDAELSALKAKIKASIGDATVGYFPGGEFSWKRQGGNAKYAKVDLSLIPKLTVPFEVVSSPETRVLRARRRS